MSTYKQGTKTVFFTVFSFDDLHISRGRIFVESKTLSYDRVPQSVWYIKKHIFDPTKKCRLENIME